MCDFLMYSVNLGVLIRQGGTDTVEFSQNLINLIMHHMGNMRKNFDCLKSKVCKSNINISILNIFIY